MEIQLFSLPKRKKLAKKKLATLQVDRCRVWEHIEQIPKAHRGSPR
jgi:hypothetical protein